MLFNLKALSPKIPVSKEYPYWNEPTSVINSVTTKPKSYDDIDWWLERTPEMLSIINAIVTDVMADGFTFIGGKQAVAKATKFAELTNYSEQLKMCLTDRFTYGDDYLWLGIPSSEDIKKVYQKITGSKDVKEDLLEPDEDWIKMLKYVPTTTMNIIHNGKVIKKFRQRISGRDTISFDPAQIIHGKYLNVKGKIYGYSPAIALLSEMSTLSYIKDYTGNFFRNGGVPDYMFIFPNEMPNSPTVTQMEQKLKKYQSPQGKHGNMVFTGEMNIEKVGAGLNKDMEHRQHAVYLTAVMGLSYGLPMSRIASIIGSEVKVSAGADDLANEGYWSQINNHQKYTENLHNAQLWEKYFGVKLRFNKAWKINEIKEQQRNQFAISNLTGLNNELARYGKQVSYNYVKKTFYLEEHDIEPINEEFEKKKIEQQTELQRPKQLDNKQIERGGATEKMREQKKKEVRPEQKLGLKSKLTHKVRPNLFYDKFNRWVKQSQTRECYYYRKNGVINASISTPDENFTLEIQESELDPVMLKEIMGFGKETQGVV